MMKKIKIMITLMVIFIASLSATSVFAENPYGIVYSGGSELGTKVQVDPELISTLRPIITHSTNNVILPNPELWQEGYYKMNANTCSKLYYFTVWPGHSIDSSDGYSYIQQDGQYYAEVKINNIMLENLDHRTENTAIPIALLPHNGLLSLGARIFTDSSCQNMAENTSVISAAENGGVFVEVQAKLYNNDKQPVVSDSLYLAISDIDAAQSYKILNSDNLLSPNNMYAKSETAFLPSNTTLRNMYVASGNYIYSQYSNGGGFDINGPNTLFVSLTENTQKEGLRLVFGFVDGGGSGIQYYAKDYPVVIEPEAEEEVPANGQEATTSEAATPEVAVPNTGTSISETNATLVPISVFGVLLGASIIVFLRRRIASML